MPRIRAKVDPGSRRRSFPRNSEVAILALVFDFDGLFLDARAAEYQSWREVFVAHGTRIPGEDSREDTDPLPPSADLYSQLERQLGESVNREAIRQKIGTRTSELLSEQTLPSGIRNLIERAEELGLRLGITSNAERSSVETRLQRLALHERFSAIGCTRDGEEKSRGPALYHSLCAALDVNPHRSIAVESTALGVHSAKGAGLYCVSIPNALTGTVSMDAADLVLVSLDAMTLDEIIERASRRNCPSP